MKNKKQPRCDVLRTLHKANCWCESHSWWVVGILCLIAIVIGYGILGPMIENPSDPSMWVKVR